MDSVHVRGTTLHYRSLGRGPPVVFVHGGFSDHRQWDPQLPVIAHAGFRAIAYSRRYARPNEDLPAGEKDRMEEHVDDLAALLEALGVAPAHLVGNSWGGFICLALAIARPRLVASLAITEPPALPLVIGQPASPATLARSLLRRPALTLSVLGFAARTAKPAGRFLLRGDHEAGLQRFIQGVLGPEHVRRLAPARLAQMRENTRAAEGQARADGGFARLTDADVRNIRAATLLLEGAESPPIFGRLTDRLAQLLPHAERALVPRASHNTNEGNAEGFNQALLRFLAAHSSGSGSQGERPPLESVESTRA